MKLEPRPYFNISCDASRFFFEKPSLPRRRRTDSLKVLRESAIFVRIEDFSSLPASLVRCLPNFDRAQDEVGNTSGYHSYTQEHLLARM